PDGGRGPRLPGRAPAGARDLARGRRLRHPPLRAVARELHPVLDQLELLGLREEGAVADLPRPERVYPRGLPRPARGLRALAGPRGARDRPGVRGSAALLGTRDARGPLHAGFAHGALRLLRAVRDLERQLVPVPRLGLRAPRLRSRRRSPAYVQRLAVHRSQPAGEGRRGAAPGARAQETGRAVRDISLEGQRWPLRGASRGGPGAGRDTGLEVGRLPLVQERAPGRSRAGLRGIGERGGETHLPAGLRGPPARDPASAPRRAARA